MKTSMVTSRMFTAPTLILTSVSCLGVSMITTQIIMLRELLHLFSGNELVIGITLGNWLLCTGLGSLLGSKKIHPQNAPRFLVAGQALIAILPILMVWGLRAAKLAIIPGQVPGLATTFALSLALILPYCLVSGFLLPLFSAMAGKRKTPVPAEPELVMAPYGYRPYGGEFSLATRVSSQQNQRFFVDAAHIGSNQIGNVYLIDIAGDILGGILFTFCLSIFFTTFQTLSFLLVLNLLAASILCRTTGSVAFIHGDRLMAAGIAALLIVSITAIFFIDMEKTTGKFLFKNQEVLFQQSTPYGHLSINRQPGSKQLTVYQNGVALASTNDPVAAEEGVHFPLSQHPEPASLLVIGGALSGVLAEAQKYKPQRIDYLEINPALLALTINLWPQTERHNLSLISEDARRFISKKNNTYDAILISAADPTTAQLNRFYTVEFFQQAYRALKKGGIIGFSLSGAENYLNPELRAFMATIHTSLSQVFANVIIIPGSRHYFLASDAALDYDIGARLAAKNIQTLSVNNNYLKARLTQSRIMAVKQVIDVKAPANHDFQPTSYSRALAYWLSHFQANLLLPLVIIALVTMISLALMGQGPQRAANCAIFSSGFTGMGLTVIILLTFQICRGALYKEIGLIFTTFLIGAAAGAFFSVRKTRAARRKMIFLDLCLGIFAVAMAAILYFAGERLTVLPGAILLVLLPFLNLMAGFLVGGQFPLAAALSFSGVEKTAARLYALDYLGAALGALTITIFLVPRFGLPGTCLLLACVKFGSTGLLLFQKEPARQQQFLPTAVNHWQPAAATLVFFLVMGILLGNNATMPGLYTFSYSQPYQWLVFLLLLIGMAYTFQATIPGIASQQGRALFSQLDGKVFQQSKVALYRWTAFFCLALVAFFPIFRCYFKIPYLFCHVCPRRCIFGLMRPYLIPAALIMNFDKRFWCFQACPLGTLFDTQPKIKGRRELPRFFSVLPLAVLILTVYAYFRTQTDFSMTPIKGDWYSALYANSFKTSTAVLIISFALLAASLKIKRIFCEYLCPIGTCSRLIGRTEQACWPKHSGGDSHG